MKTIALIHYADPDFSPHMRRQAVTLKRRGFRVWAIGISHPDQKKHGDSVFDRTDTIQQPASMMRGPLAFITFFLKAFLILWKERIDILQPIDAPALVPACLHAILRRIPLYYFSLEDIPYNTTLVNHPVKRVVWTSIERWGISIARRVAVVARIDAESFRNRYHIPLPRIIRNVPDLIPLLDNRSLLLRKRFGWNETDTVLMYHGLIEYGRGVERVFPLLKKMPQLRYGIAGYGDYAETVQKMIQDQGLENQVGWIGPFAHADLGLWIQDADIGIILLENLSLGLYQALPCKLFEYVHAAVPVIASNFPEMKSYIENTGVGITVDAGNLDEAETGLMKMINDKTFYATCKNACRLEREKTNWETESSEYYKFLDIESV